MTPKRVFITGASGCIGHYLTEALIQNTQHELFILVRNPSKLRFDYRARPGVTLLEGDLRQIEQHQDLLATIDVAVLTATAWGGAEESYDVNVRKTLALIQALDPDRVEQILYFSTESILDANNQLLPEAYELGTDYIRTKYLCFKELESLAIRDRITVLCPSLVFGGDENKPYSHLTSGISEVMRWLWLIRFFDIDASFHYVHAYDIGQVVQQLVNEPPREPIAPGSLRKMILGNPSTTANRAVDEACQYFNQRRVFTVPIRVWLAEFLIRIFRIQVGPWDRFCIRYRHFVHQNPVNPGTFGLPIYGATFSDLLKLSGMMPKQRYKAGSGQQSCPEPFKKMPGQGSGAAPLKMIRADVGQESGAGVHQQLDDIVKAFGTTVVGIGDFTVAMALGKFAHHLHLGPVESFGFQGQNPPVVVRIHGQDSVKFLEVLGYKLARFAFHGDALFASGNAHAAIGGLADMVASRARRVAADLITQTRFGNEVSHDIFRRGRSADIAQTNEQNPIHSCAPLLAVQTINTNNQHKGGW